MYVDRFYRNLADNLDNLLGSDFYGQIAGDYDKPSADAQKYLLATSESAKGMQTDIYHYAKNYRIHNARFRQKLDPISKNILRRKSPLELVFENISTFDGKNLIVIKDIACEVIKKDKEHQEWILPSEKN